ncbi:trehalose utilization protein ThuA, partial [Paenibacillus sp. 28ISP30-2]|nr:trehalose utilization protein ThuA [Paenibacillus sp. 28ISP30-2]
MINVTIWNEFLNVKLNDEAKQVYPDGIHKALADGLSGEGFAIRTATLRDDAQHGLGEEILN